MEYFAPYRKDSANAVNTNVIQLATGETIDKSKHKREHELCAVNEAFHSYPPSPDIHDIVIVYYEAQEREREKNLVLSTRCRILRNQ